RGDPGGDAVRSGNDKAAALHRPRETLTQRRVVVDNQQRTFGVGQTAQRGRYPFRGAGAIGSLTLTHGICPWRRPRSTDPLATRRDRRRGGAGSFYGFQIGTIPRNRNMRAAAIGKVFEGESRATAFEQALRDEYAEPHMVGRTGAGREVGFTEAPEQVEGKPRPVIVDLDRDRRRIPID